MKLKFLLLVLLVTVGCNDTRVPDRAAQVLKMCAELGASWSEYHDYGRSYRIGCEFPRIYDENSAK